MRPIRHRQRDDPNNVNNTDSQRQCCFAAISSNKFQEATVRASITTTDVNLTSPHLKHIKSSQPVENFGYNKHSFYYKLQNLTQ